MSSIILDTVNLLKEDRKYDLILSKITFRNFCPINVYASMIQEEKENLSFLLKGVDYLFSNLMYNEYDIIIFVSNEDEKTEIESFLKEKEKQNKINIRIK